MKIPKRTPGQTSGAGEATEAPTEVGDSATEAALEEPTPRETTGTVPRLHALSTPRRDSSNKISKSAHPSSPWTAQRSRQLSATLDFQGSTLARTVSLTFLTLDIYTVNIWTLGKISISFQLAPPGSSTKSASASTTRQQHQISISFQLPPPGSSTTQANLQQGLQSTSC